MQKPFKTLLNILHNGKKAVFVTTCRTSGIDRRVYEDDSLKVEHEDDSLGFTEKGDEIILIERFLPRPRMIIYGAGHIAVPLVHMASMLEFDVSVFDDRPSFANRERFPDAKEVLCDSFNDVASRITIRSSDYVIIITRGHRHDQECLRSVLCGEIPYYMGMIGSRRRVAIVRKQMTDEGYASELIERLHSPIGLSIGAVTPEEIGISILAEVVREKRLRPLEIKSDLSTVREERYADMDLTEFLANEKLDGAALVTVISTEGSTPREAGAKMVVLYDGRSVGSIGGGCAEAEVMRDARNNIQNGGYSIKIIDMTDSAEEDGMVCGGRMKVLIENLAPL